VGHKPPRPSLAVAAAIIPKPDNAAAQISALNITAANRTGSYNQSPCWPQRMATSEISNPTPLKIAIAKKSSVTVFDGPCTSIAFESRE